MAATFLRRRRLLTQVQEGDLQRSGILKMAGGLGLVALYPLLQPHIGFAVTLGGICFLVALLLRARVWVAVLTALGTVLFIYLVFINLLGLSL